MDVRRSTVEPLYDADVNILGSINVLECARKFQVKRFIYISSGGAVYGEPEYVPCDEIHPINPICQYGASKHTVEHYLYLYHHIYGLEYIVLRYGNVYGPRQNPRGEAGVVAIFTGQMLSDQQVMINGDGEQQRDFVYVKDCARANLLAFTARNANAIYNVGCGVGTSVNEIFQILKELSGYHKNPYYGPAKEGETRRIYLNCIKAQSGLGWTSTMGIHNGLEDTVNYMKSDSSTKVTTSSAHDYQEIPS
jgi:UDP-glucose 4-epimerase